MTSVTDVNSTKTTYAYDSEGRRIQKVNQADTTTYGYDAMGQLAAEYGGRAALPDETGTRYLFGDHLGSTRLTVKGDGTGAKPLDYLPFGEEIGGGSYPVVGGGMPVKFTGKERDAETGLDYMLARYYSSGQGRFTSPDEWAGGIVDAYTGGQVGTPGPLPYADLGDPQTINKYVYVRNNPLRYTDPDGHIAIADDVLIVTAVAVGTTVAYFSLQGPQRNLQNAFTAATAAITSWFAKEQSRGEDGKFKPKEGGESSPGSEAEAAADKIIAGEGNQIVGNHIPVTATNGKGERQTRVYDTVYKDPKTGETVGVETKKGAGRKTAGQRDLDKQVNQGRGNVKVGPKGTQAGIDTIDRVRDILIP
jgi:RHS repeat-associated protein